MTLKGIALVTVAVHYDRLLSSTEWTPSRRIVFEFAYLPCLPIDFWDKQLHGVCTETSLRIK